MNNNRTGLGNFTFAILSAYLILVVINYSVSLIPSIASLFTIENEFPEEWAPHSYFVGMGIVIIIILIPILLLLFFLISRYWDAFRKNDISKIKGVTIFFVVIFGILIIMCLIATIFQALYPFPLPQRDTSITSILLYFVITEASYIILLLELSPSLNVKMQYAWIIMIVLVSARHVISLLSRTNSDNSSVAYSVISFMSGLCFDLGIVLISKWIVDPDKFYSNIDEETKLRTRRVENKSAETSIETDEYSSQLRELKHLLDDGLINKEDYEAKKYEVLGLKGSDWDY